MDEQELCKKRLIDLSRQADTRDIVTFSSFLNLNEQNIYHSVRESLYTATELFGGYDMAERQMVAFLPDALCYEWDYPIVCIKAVPQYPKFAENLTHRDILGAVMHLGIDRSRIGDILCRNNTCYIFCEESIHEFLMDHLTQVKHTMMTVTKANPAGSVDICPDFEERPDVIASNRIDAIIAKAYHFSRSEAAQYLSEEKVFINGKCITNCNQSCESGAIVSVRGKGRFVFETDQSFNKKGKLRVRFLMYC